MPSGVYQSEKRYRFPKGHIPWNKGKECSVKTKKKISESIKKGYVQGRVSPWMGKRMHPNFREGARKYHLGLCGELAPNWKGGKIKIKNERNDPLYQRWVRQVKRRDKNQCVFKGQNCFGYNVVHHILSWKDFPELRYEVNNGITLCQYHHPRKRADEQRLIPVFQELVGSKV